MGGTLPYMQVLAKDFGISPTAVGTIYTVVPLFVFLSKPIFGFITDKLRNIRAILLMLLIVTVLAFLSILFVPPIRDYKVESIEVNSVCKQPRNELVIIPPKYDSSCAEEIAGKQFDCELSSEHCLKNKTMNGILNVTKVLTGENNTSLSFSFVLSKKYVHKHECECLKHNVSSLTCEPNFYKCDSFNQKGLPEYALTSFWIFALLAIIGGAFSATAFTLTDAACYEILIDNPRDYGKQRLWATISWGIATLFSGFLNDLATGSSKYAQYYPGFYLMTVFAIVDIGILCTLRIEKVNMSTNICKDIGTIFSSSRTIVFSIGIYICGALTGLLWTYQFWFLTDLGSSQLLLGLVAGVQCLVAEVPFFFFSGWFIKTFGHFNCLIAALAAFSVRIGLYSILQNPWLVLPIDVLHGVTYAIFCSAMTLYAIDFAPVGTEATMLGIFGGIFEGLGKIRDILICFKSEASLYRIMFLLFLNSNIMSILNIVYGIAPKCLGISIIISLL